MWNLRFDSIRNNITVQQSPTIPRIQTYPAFGTQKIFGSSSRLESEASAEHETLMVNTRATVWRSALPYGTNIDLWVSTEWQSRTPYTHSPAWSPDNIYTHRHRMGPMDSIFGATLCGSVASAWTLGLVSILSYQYYSNYPKDPLSTKVLVGFLWFLQVFNQVVDTKMTYYYLVSSFGNFPALTSATWEWSAYLGIEAVAASCVQIYYARRIFLCMLSYASLIPMYSYSPQLCYLGTMGVTIRVKLFTEFIPWTWICLSWLGCSAACDVSIAGVQVWYLMVHKTGIRSTDRILNKLIIYIISTGLLTSVVAILEISTVYKVCGAGIQLRPRLFELPQWRSVYAVFAIKVMSCPIFATLFPAYIDFSLDVRRRVHKFGPNTSNFFVEGSALDPQSIHFKSRQTETAADSLFTNTV
ncbi:hypothetical protein EW146_g8339 [Bondarzewia mesenterica]|uniref:DUF6534 domain-containing protein n=1 Tax=Bondarzewia mesenterica TaxID=1095465 RepID=A0A4S4LF77_9AGAM|nr:hypothetical protein EW146_g8339 [Bondarzewia mesenterica]